jgi:hypothetical protein
MIKKTGETGKSTFKKFSDFDKKSDPKEGTPQEIIPDSQEKIPANPNLPVESSKKQKNADTKPLMPVKDTEDTNEKVKLFGKVAKLPKNTKASKGFNFLENVKISKNSIWYIMVERQDNELQMVKYNHKKGVDLSKFVNELKLYYISKYSGNKKIIEMVQNITIEGNDKYSKICNIPLVEVENKKMITRITEDLIKLLSK